MMKIVNNLGKLGNCFELCTAISLQVCNKKEYKEIEETIFLARSILSNFMKKSPSEHAFTFFISEIENTLDGITTAFNNKKNNHEGREDTKLRLFDLDYLLKQQMEQINFEFVHCNEISSAALIEDVFAKKFWIENFGNERIVEKSKFIEELAKAISLNLSDKEMEHIEYYLDFVEDGYISVYEFQKFLMNFGPFRCISKNIKELIQKDIMIYRISSKRANTLLDKKKVGNYLLRFSKSQSNSFAITYIDQKKSIKNSLIVNTKDGVKTTSSNTLYPSLINFLQVHKCILKSLENVPLSLVKSFSISLINKLLSSSSSELTQSPKTISSVDDLPSLTSNSEGNEVDNHISSVCISCLKSQKDSVMDCKHFICCYNCSLNLKACPICKAPNNNPIQIFVC